ncbi:hypothetical protein [Tardiphaga sp. 11_C7_N12_6]|uniref:hypothetical protein n=1 Tax=Tardiphaga sp. 11_C7_N12_6 TaxID=3240789 RepID=UPI003F21CA72
MDNYPKHLAPALDEGGGVTTPFDKWWREVQHAFPYVPVNVAQYWLHEHWGQSPYDYLESKNYRFELQEWRSTEITSIVSRLSNFKVGNPECTEQGKYFVESFPGGKPYKTSAYMLRHGEWPQPIIVLDNHDGHLLPECTSKPYQGVPKGFILIEGHRRFATALHLLNRGGLNDKLKLWIMRKVSA